MPIFKKDFAEINLVKDFTLLEYLIIKESLEIILITFTLCFPSVQVIESPTVIKSPFHFYYIVYPQFFVEKIIFNRRK